MQVPDGMTEQEVLDSIDKVANGLAYKYKFGYYSVDDIKQEARVEALKALEKYEPKKGKLETFLWTSVKNGLFNLRRNKYERLDKPCLNCPLKAYDPYCENSTSKCTEYEDKMNCELYAKWITRNSTKKNIMSPIGMCNVRDENEQNMSREDDVGNKIDYNEMVELIDKNIPVKLRRSWIKMKSDVKMPKAERRKLLEAIREILAENEYGT